MECVCEVLLKDTGITENLKQIKWGLCPKKTYLDVVHCVGKRKGSAIVGDIRYLASCDVESA